MSPSALRSAPRYIATGFKASCWFMPKEVMTQCAPGEIAVRLLLEQGELYVRFGPFETGR